LRLLAETCGGFVIDVVRGLWRRWSSVVEQWLIVPLVFRRRCSLDGDVWRIIYRCVDRLVEKTELCC
jgi:hypothetical protein